MDEDVMWTSDEECMLCLHSCDGENDYCCHYMGQLSVTGQTCVSLWRLSLSTMVQRHPRRTPLLHRPNDPADRCAGPGGPRDARARWGQHLSVTAKTTPTLSIQGNWFLHISIYISQRVTVAYSEKRFPSPWAGGEQGEGARDSYFAWGPVSKTKEGWSLPLERFVIGHGVAQNPVSVDL